MVTSLTFWHRVGLRAALYIGVVAVAFEMWAINSTMKIIAAPDALNAMQQYAWAFTMFSLGQVFSIIVVGRLVDRFGAFKPLAVGTGLFILGLALAGSAHHIYTFLAARAVQGLGGGALNIALMVVIAEVYPGRQRSNMMMWFSFCYMGPAFVGPGVASFIAVNMGWRYVFWLIIPLMLIAAAVGVKPFFELYGGRKSRGAAQGEMPVWAAVAGIGGLAIIQAVTQTVSGKVIHAIEWQWILLAIVGLVAVGVAMPRLMPAGFWRIRPGMPALMWVRMTLAGSYAAALNFLVLMLTMARGLGQHEASWSLAFGATGWALGMMLQSRRWFKVPRDQIIKIGAFITTVCMAGIGVYAAVGVPGSLVLPVLLVVLVAAGFGMGLAVSSTSLALMTLSPPETIGHNTSSLQVADGLGSAFFVGVAGAIWAALHVHYSWQVTFAWLYAANGIVALLALVLTITRLGHVRNESSGYG